MKGWNTPDHHIAGTDHATLRFADGTEIVIADWQMSEDAPTPNGAVYQTLRGWVADDYKDPSGPYRITPNPAPRGPQRLVTADLRGREPLTDLDVECGGHSATQPYPNTWDHRGYLFHMTWKARQLAVA